MKRVILLLQVVLIVFFVSFAVTAAEKRYKDMKNGTIYDANLQKTWLRDDSYKDKNEWLNWRQAQEYIRHKNMAMEADFSDWRLPTRKELKSLYDRRSGQPTYDQSTNIYHSKLFNTAFCYFWTNEIMYENLIWQVSLCNGKAYPTLEHNGPGNSVLLIRP